jgi:predicted short-subunit dehydrogenase-like oxidoreductase (DUF2520 family)
MSRALPTVAVFGAGKLGHGLYRAMRAARIRGSLRAARRGLPERPFEGSLLVLAVRESTLGDVVDAIVRGRLLHPDMAVVHVSGGLAPDALAALRPHCAGVGQLHPMIAFASTTFAPSFVGCHARVAGDAVAVRRARALASRLGMRPRALPGLDPVAYHAAAGLVANGAAALAAAGSMLLKAAGVPSDVTPRLLGPLLGTVADNVEALGLPGALTGPVRRGDARGVAAHLAAIERLAPALLPLYDGIVRAQLPLARALGDAPADAFDAIERGLDERGSRLDAMQTNTTNDEAREPSKACAPSACDVSEASP